jgi:hypothetical protein
VNNNSVEFLLVRCLLTRILNCQFIAHSPTALSFAAHFRASHFSSYSIRLSYHHASLSAFLLYLLLYVHYVMSYIINHINTQLLLILLKFTTLMYFLLTAIWISPNATSAQLFDIIRQGFSFVSIPHAVCVSRSS